MSEKLQLMTIYEMETYSVTNRIPGALDRNVIDGLAKDSAFETTERRRSKKDNSFIIRVDEQGYFCGVELNPFPFYEEDVKTVHYCVGRILPEKVAFVRFHTAELDSRYSYNLSKWLHNVRDQRRYKVALATQKKDGDEINNDEAWIVELFPLPDSTEYRKTRLEMELRVINEFRSLPKFHKKLTARAKDLCERVIAKDEALAK